MAAQAGVPATGPIQAWVHGGLGRRRALPRPPLWLLAGGFTLLAAGITAMLVAPEAGPKPPLAEPAQHGPASESFFNRRAGYSFRYPPRWRVEPNVTATMVASPGRDAVITFGLGAAGTLDHAEATLVTEVQDSYQGTRLAAVEAQRIGGRTALSVSGTGINSGGIRIRFVAITVRGLSRNYSITVFTPADVRTSVLPRIQEVVSSFRTS
jgi:hypothetical protein